jgi:hypothetical protein
MKMKGIVWCFVLPVSFLLVAFLCVTPIHAKPQESNVNKVKPAEAHPLITTPEKTLEIVLTSFIARDIATFMAYVPERIKEKIPVTWRDQVKLNALEHMTDKKHVIKIIGIQLQKIEDLKANKIAHLVAKVEISKDFLGPGINITDSQGKTSAIYKWKFRQLNSQGPWFYDEGGF